MPLLARALANAIRYVAVALLAFYLALVLAQVFCRYVLGVPIFWTEELIRYGLVWSVMICSGLVAYEHGHLRVDSAVRRLPERLRLRVVRGVDALTVVFLAALLYAGIDFVAGTLGQTSASLELPVAVVYAAVPVCAAVEIALTLFRPRDPGPRDEGAGFQS